MPHLTTLVIHGAEPEVRNGIIYIQKIEYFDARNDLTEMAEKSVCGKSTVFAFYNFCYAQINSPVGR